MNHDLCFLCTDSHSFGKIISIMNRSVSNFEVITMFVKKICFLMTAVLVMGVLTGLAQTTVDIPDTYNSLVSNTFDVTDGTIVSNAGVLVIFEGELSIDTNVTASADNYDRVLASTQIYIEMTLFNDLPDVNLFTNSQAAVLAVFDESSTTEGTLYALSDLGSEISWVQLTNNATATPIAVTAGTTNLITVILRYPGTGYTDNEYTVSISEYDSVNNESGPMIASQNLNSVTEPTTYEITGLSLMGEGAVSSMSNVSGDPELLSARVDFSVYQSTNGVFLVDLYTVDENGEGYLDVYAYIGGEWVLIGSVKANGDGSHNYQVYVTGIVLGESYRFKVVDEEGHTHLSYGEIEVKNIEMHAVQLDLETFSIQFNSDESRIYSLVMSSDISAPLDQWTVETVQVKVDGVLGVEQTKFSGGPGGTTQISVPKNRNKAFFKILLLPVDDTSSAGGNIP